MTSWEILLVSPLKVSMIRTAITQQRIPCSMYKQAWDPCIVVAKGRQVGTNRRGEKGERLRWTIKAALQLGAQDRAHLKGGFWLWVVLPSAGRSNEVWWAFLEEQVVWAAAAPSDLRRTQQRGTSVVVGGHPSRQRNKAPGPCLPVASRSSSAFALCVELRCTLPANLRTSTTELLSSLHEGHTLWSLPGSGLLKNPAEIQCQLYWKNKVTKKLATSPAHPTPTHQGYIDSSIWMEGTGIS